MIKFIDVSHWEGKLDCKYIKSKGINYAYNKCTEGTTIFDDTYLPNLTGMRENKIINGAYHYLQAKVDPIAQANFFYSHAKDSLLPPVVDVENYGNESVSQTAFATAVIRFINEADRLFGRKLMIYTGYYVWKDRIGYSTGLEVDHPLWIATYGPGPMIPQKWTKWTYWQYTDKEDVWGDTDWFNGTDEEFRKLLPSQNQIFLPIVSSGTVEDRLTKVEADIKAIKEKIGPV